MTLLYWQFVATKKHFDYCSFYVVIFFHKQILIVIRYFLFCSPGIKLNSFGIFHVTSIRSHCLRFCCKKNANAKIANS